MSYSPKLETLQPTAAYFAPVWKGLTVSRNTDGHDEAFAIGPDDYVWSYLTSAESGASGRLVSTGIEALQFVLVTPPNGCRALVAAGSSTLRFTAESSGADRCWQKSQPITFSGLQNAIAISELHSLVINGHALIGVLAVYQNLRGLDTYRFWVAKWNGEQLQWRGTQVALDGTDPLGNQFIMNRKSSEQTLQ